MSLLNDVEFDFTNLSFIGLLIRFQQFGINTKALIDRNLSVSTSAGLAFIRVPDLHLSEAVICLHTYVFPT
jgi:hypothetical protein